MKKKIILKPKKLFVKSGDIVKVITGDYKNKTGKIIDVDTKRELVKIEGIKMMTHFIKAKSKQEPGRIEKKEGFLHISNVKLVEASTEIVFKKDLKKKEVINENI